MTDTRNNGLPFRSRTYHPDAPNSIPMHLRVICGVCPHFQGEQMRDVAMCDLHKLARAGVQRGCDNWTRKMAGPVIIEAAHGKGIA